MLGSTRIVMDIETAGAVDALRSDIQAVDRRLTLVDTSLTAELVGVETTLIARIIRFETSLTAEIDRVETSLRSEMHELHEDGKRHTTVVIESLRDDIRL